MSEDEIGDNDSDLYSDEYESDESEIEDEHNPWGASKKESSGQGRPNARKKERIRRRGRIPLNLTQNYGLRSGWGVRQGIRELIQNFADNVRENPDGSLRIVDWVFEETPNDQAYSYIAYAQGTKPRPHRQTGLYNRKKSLGYIIYRKPENRFILVNKNTSLSRRIWSMGETSKGTSPHHIGGHGEGMKVGILALLRADMSVTYYTNKEIWDWIFYDWIDPRGKPARLLTIDLHPYQPRKARNDPFISDDVREARRTAKCDTTVIVEGGYQELDIEFKDYLFLVNPPPDTLLETNFGAILTSDNYKSKIFVKGIFVEKRGSEDPPALYYSVDFSKAALDRDRRSLMTGPQVTATLSKIWNELVSKDKGDAATRYLKLLLDKDDHLETLEASKHINNSSARKLFNTLSLLRPGKFFYNSEDPNVSEASFVQTLRLIKDCLQKVPEPIPRRLYEIFRRYNIVKTAEEERLRLFSDTPIMDSPWTDPWIKHTVYAFETSLLIHPFLRNSTFVFRNAPETIAIDIIEDKKTESSTRRFEFHRHWLDFTYVHKQRPSCPLFQSIQSGAEPEVACDCGVEELFDLVLSETGNLKAPEIKSLRRLHKDLLNSMPRHFKVSSKETESGKVRTELCWETFISTFICPSFDVLVFSKDYSTITKEEHRFYNAAEPIVSPDSEDSSPEKISTPEDGHGDDVEKGSGFEPEEESSSHVSEHSSGRSHSESVSGGSDEDSACYPLWQGKTERTSSLVIGNEDSKLLPGTYIALVRLAGERKCFFSVPFVFNILCPSPQNIEVKRNNARFTVTWDYPLAINPVFRVTCESIYDTHYVSDLITERIHDFEIDSEILMSGELEISVHPEIEDGVGGHKAVFKVESLSLNTTSPSMQSIYDSCDEYIPEMPRSKLPPPLKPRPVTIDSPDESDNDTISGTMGCQIDSNIDLPAKASESCLVPRTEATGPRLQENVSSTTLSIPIPNYGLIYSGRTYHIETYNYGPAVINIHKICLVQGQPAIYASLFVSHTGLFNGRIEDTCDESDPYLLVYQNWEHVGAEESSLPEPIRVNQIKRVIRPCSVRLPPRRPEGFCGTDSFDVIGSSDTRDVPVYSVEWAVTAQTLSCISVPYYIEVRNLHNLSNRITLDSADLDSLVAPFTVHDYNCGIGGATSGFEDGGFKVSIAVEPDKAAADTWKSNHTGVIYPDEIDPFLEKFHTRLGDDVFTLPSVTLISAHCRDVGNEGSGNVPPHSVCDSIKAILRTAHITNPPVLVSKLGFGSKHQNCRHNKLCIETLHKELIDMRYEYRITEEKASDFGWLMPDQCFYILVASKIGLPDLPVNSMDCDLRDILREYGFKNNYRICGDRVTQMRQVREAFPPLMANAIARSIREHFNNVLERVNFLQNENAAEVNMKRKAENVLQNEQSKKVR